MAAALETSGSILSPSAGPGVSSEPPQNLLAVVTPGDEESGAPLVNPGLSTFCCIPPTEQSSPVLEGLVGLTGLELL